MRPDGERKMEEASRNPETVSAELAVRLMELSEICAKLESIADGLPENVNPQDCIKLARSIYPAIVSAHEFEEGVVFPMLRSAPHEPALDDTIERLRFEHWEDESFAAELQDTLCSFVTGREPGTAETLAWMLRGFFEGLRRHIAFEREHVMPMLARSAS